MPAPQQTAVPVYKETGNIPRPNTARYMIDPRDTPGYKLARLLNIASDKMSSQYQKNKKQAQQQVDEINIGAAQTGMEKMNLASAANTFDLITGDFEPDSYDMKQGQLEAASFSGDLREAYMSEKAYEMTDPKDFNRWLHTKIQQNVTTAKGKGVSYYNGYMKELGGNVELLTKQYAGKVNSVLENKNATAFKSKLKLAMEADAATTKAGELGGWLRTFLASESSGNWNAWFGNSGNTEDLSQLTIGDILKRQAEPGNDAAGLIQIVPGTLKGMVRDYGYSEDTKFTPQVQTEMALFLMKEKGLDKWINGEMTDGAFADNLAKVWAGLKTSSGKGVYDGDGVNGASQSHDVSVSQLQQLRILLDGNPQLKKVLGAKKTSAGSAQLLLESASGGSNTNRLLSDAKGTGVSNVKARDLYVEALGDAIKSGADVRIDDDWLQQQFEEKKLSKQQREEITNLVERRRQQDAVEAKETRRSNIQTGLDVITSGDPKRLTELRGVSEDWYDAAVTRANIEETPEMEKASEEALDGLDFTKDSSVDEAFKMYLGGDMTLDDLRQAQSQRASTKTYQSIVKVPAIRDYIKATKRSLSGRAGQQFEQLTTAAINDMISQGEGARPAIADVLETVDRMADIAANRADKDRSALMANYNL